MDVPHLKMKINARKGCACGERVAKERKKRVPSISKRENGADVVWMWRRTIAHSAVHAFEGVQAFARESVQP